MGFVFVEKAVRRTVVQPRTFSLAMQLQRRFGGPLLQALRELQGRVKLAPLARDAAVGDVQGVLIASRVDRVADITANLAGELKYGIAAGARSAAADLKSKVSIDLERPKIARWLDQHTGELITNVTDGSRNAVRAVLSDGVLSGRHPAQIAKDIQKVIGLNERQANAVIRRRAALSDAGVPVARAQEIVDGYAGRLLKQRANLIAQHESMVAVSHGRAELWDQLQERGALDADQLKRWDTSDDEGVCLICGPMDGQLRKLDEAFETGDGGLVGHPPAHIGCRCVVGLA